MRHIIFGHQFANENFAKRLIVLPLLHTSKIIARDFPSVRKSKLALSAHSLASAAPTANFLSTRHRRTLALGMTSTTLADLLRPPLVANPFSTMRASLRR